MSTEKVKITPGMFVCVFLTITKQHTINVNCLKIYPVYFHIYLNLHQIAVAVKRNFTRSTRLFDNLYLSTYPFF